MKVRRADVVIIDHPFSDASGAKVRPALVVQSDPRNGRLTETVVALISTNVRHVGTDTAQLLVDIASPDGQASGLKQTSAVKCGKLFTIHEGLVRRKIGVLSPTLMLKINDCLKMALELP
jgi:mRNA interferase MazF